MSDNLYAVILTYIKDSKTQKAYTNALGTVFATSAEEAIALYKLKISGHGNCVRSYAVAIPFHIIEKAYFLNEPHP